MSSIKKTKVHSIKKNNNNNKNKKREKKNGRREKEEEEDEEMEKRRRRMAACHMVGISDLWVCSVFKTKKKKKKRRSKSDPFLKTRNQFLCKVDIFVHVLVKPCLYIVLFI